MIDLGDELASYGKKPPSEPTNPEGMGSFGRLADLQAGGFNVKPQWSFNGLRTLKINTMPLVANQLTRMIAGLAGAPSVAPPFDNWLSGNDGFEPTGSISGDDMGTSTTGIHIDDDD